MPNTTTGREWGPARRHSTDRYCRTEVHAALDQRDGAERLPDDN